MGNRETVELSLETLAELDGGIVNAIVADLQTKAAIDCMNRPEESKPRTINVQLEYTPVFERGECVDVNVQVLVKAAQPVSRTRVYRVGVKRNGRLFFAPENPDDIGQRGLDFDDKKDK